MIDGPVWLMQPIPWLGENLKGDWLVEPKFDGWRLQIIRYPDGRVEFWGRRMERKPNWTDKLPDLAATAKKTIPAGVILDAELYSSAGRRMVPSLFARKPRAESIVYIFDVIYHEGEFVGETPLVKRKDILRSIGVKPPFHIIGSENLTDLPAAFENAVKAGQEGLVIKRADSAYEIGKDAPVATLDWRKVKKLYGDRHIVL
jgi:ATP-dependent DNA ligase